MSSRAEGSAVDGRTARRERNRDAALDAATELFVERHALPTVEDVAARSGVSARSLYRYFPDARELQLAALARRVRSADHHFELAAVGEGGLEERIERFVDQRLDIYDAAASVIRAAYAMAPELPAIREQVHRRKEALAQQTRQHFTAELDSLPPAVAEDVLVGIEVCCQFESLETMRAGQGLTRARAKDVLVLALSRLLRVG